MRTVIQRVSQARVTVNGEVTGSIGMGMLLLVGIEEVDGDDDIEWLSGKIVNLRIFSDDNGVMNRSVKEVNGELLVVSQFTLHASIRKGNRPSYSKAARPDMAKPVYEAVIQSIESGLEQKVSTGQFGAYMELTIVNDGPVTIYIDTKNKE